MEMIQRGVHLEWVSAMQSAQAELGETSSVLSLTVDSQDGAGVRVCANEQD
jgi:hypothetical protein